LSHIENIFKSELDKLKNLKIVKEIRLAGLLCAIDLHQNIGPKKFFQKGLYLVSQTNRIILAPPLIISESLLKEAMKKIYEVLKESE
ncbi:MAG: aminotransferase class III-fold pyridoxal phosphate-dependent enzyme, partial [Bacteriovorax sp.]|nr:aminotransferase class III-fold pyridoxal phosphate-dependent enzyme [Bacteriovorax sp.]